jgi:hypothetical protein
MEVVHPRVAGIDVHKKVIWVAVRLPGERPGEHAVTVRRFKAFWRSLQKMASWLAELGVSDAAMESTGVYWWPVYHALAGAGIEVCVCNAAHMRNVPGRKTDLLTELPDVTAAHERCRSRGRSSLVSETSRFPGRAAYRQSDRHRNRTYGAQPPAQLLLAADLRHQSRRPSSTCTAAMTWHDIRPCNSYCLVRRRPGGLPVDR